MHVYIGLADRISSRQGYFLAQFNFISQTFSNAEEVKWISNAWEDYRSCKAAPGLSSLQVELFNNKLLLAISSGNYKLMPTPMRAQQQHFKLLHVQEIQPSGLSVR